MLVLALCASLVCVFAACGKTVGDSGTVSVVVMSPVTNKATEYVVDLSDLNGQEGLMTVLKYLKDKKGLTYEETSGDYGAYLTKVADIGSKIEGNKTYYVMLMTNVKADYKDAETADAIQEPVTYKDITLHYSMEGSSSMHISDGAVIYICQGIYEYSAQ